MDLNVELPDLGDGNGDRGVIAEWHFEEGERVEKGEILLDVLAEMATITVPSPCCGRLIARTVEEDDTVRTGEIVAVIETDDELAISNSEYGK